MTTGAAAALGAAALLLGALPALAGSPRELLPNLVEPPPTQLRVQAVVVAGETRYELRFTSTAANMGAGPLVVRLVRPSSAAPFAAAQVVSLSNGSNPPHSIPGSVSGFFPPGHN